MRTASSAVVRTLAPVLALALAVLPAVAAGCGKARSAPAPLPAPAPSPTYSRPKVIPPLTADQKARLERCFAEARKLVEEARALCQQGRQIEGRDGRQAANDTYVKAKRLYKEAAEKTEDWVEPDLHVVSEDQIESFLGDYVRERGRWSKEAAELGKLHD